MFSVNDFRSNIAFEICHATELHQLLINKINVLSLSIDRLQMPLEHNTLWRYSHISVLRRHAIFNSIMDAFKDIKISYRVPCDLV